MGRHIRFLVALGVGAAVLFAAQSLDLAIETRLLIAVDCFYLTYLAMIVHFAQTTTAADLRRHAASADEGLPVILTLAVLILGISLTAIITALNGPAGGGLAKRFLALVSVPLGWLTLQILISFHYAHMYYRPKEAEAFEPLQFPGAEDPGPWDFLYFTFVLAMCAQVSDVTTNARSMRKVVLVHSVGSFFYNAVILALVVAAITADL